LDASDILLGSGNISILDPGQIESDTISVSIPETTPLGDYFLISEVDPGDFIAETDETNNLLVQPVKVVATILGIRDEIFGGLIVVYPNPVRDQLTIRMDNPYFGDYQVRIINFLGQIKFVQSFYKGSQIQENTIDVSLLQNEMYIIEISTDRNRFATRIIKQ